MMLQPHFASVEKNNKYFWLLFAVLVITEFLLFKWFVIRNIVNSYPAGFDQTTFLSQSYQAYEYIKQYGFIKGIFQASAVANTVFFPRHAVLFFIFLGASRYSALLINLIYFIALQFFCVYVIKSITKSLPFAMLFLALLLAIQSPFIMNGGLFDFRLDFIAFCIYGIFVCCVLRSRVFAERKWSLLTAVVVSLGILMRSLTAVYYFLVMTSLLAYFLINKKAESKERLLNLILAGLVIGVITIPCLCASWRALYGYYVVGHVISDEKFIRLAEVGIKNAFGSIFYYPHSLLFVHIRRLALEFCAVIMAIYACLYFQHKSSIQRAIKQTNPLDLQQWQSGLVFLLIAIFVPMLVLTWDTSKSTIVASIMIVPTLWLVLWCCMYVNLVTSMSVKAQRFVYYAAALILLISVYNFIHIYTYLDKKRQFLHLGNISKMYLDIGDYARKKNWPEISISTDQVQDYLVAGAIKTFYYEKTGTMLPINSQQLGGSIFAINEPAALAGLQASQVFIYNLGKYVDQSYYPFDNTIVPIKPMLKSYAEQHMHILGDYQFKGSVYRVYVTD